MKTDRLNAFTDGVVAIIITIMVLELRVPAGASIESIRPAIPILAAYALSFVNVGIFWANHHHMLLRATRVNGAVLWANLFLLFWLSLVPFVIRWIDVAGVTPAPVAAYGLVLVMAAIAYLLLERTLIGAEGEDSGVAQAVGSRLKEWLSFVGYASAIPLAFLVSPYVSVVLYAAVAILWLIPDRRFEHSRGTAR